MSTLKVIQIQHPSAASAALTLDASGNLSTSGTLTFPAGSASSPSIQATGDPNTGIFFPAADTIAFAEGGTEVLRIDSSGRLGLGTSSPSERLHVVGGNSRFDGNYVSFNNNGYIRTDATNELRFQAGSSGITFYSSGNSVEHGRWDSSGRFLVGTSQSPSAGELLRVEKASTGNEGAGIRLAGVFSLVNDGTQTITVGNGCLVFVSENVTGDGALFFCGYKSATVTLISDPNNRYANSVTAGRISLTKSANSSTATVTNKGGSSYTFTVGKINCSD